MTDQRENTSVLEKHLPNAPSLKPVVSERGQKEPVNRTQGGEKMNPDLRHQEHKQHTFDCFCKRALKYEAYNIYREIRRRQQREVNFSELPEESMEQLAVYDYYACERDTFVIENEVIHIENEKLAEALNALPPESRDILLMYFFLEMPDREIADCLHMARRTVNTHRIKAFQALKDRMGCDGNG